MSEKVYLNGIIIKAKQTQYGELLTGSIKVDELIKELQQNARNGWVNVNIKQRRTPSEKGVTHSVEVDTWEPGQSAAPRNGSGGQSSDADNDLPF
jgi:hypothetical protein